MLILTSAYYILKGIFILNETGREKAFSWEINNTLMYLVYYFPLKGVDKMYYPSNDDKNKYLYIYRSGGVVEINNKKCFPEPPSQYANWLETAG